MSARYKNRHKSGYNRKTASVQKKSGGWLWKFLALLVVCGAIYAAFKVPIAGKTAYNRLSQGLMNEVTKTGGSLKGVTELQEPPPKPMDKLTGKDRKELQELIESKAPGKK